MTARGMLKVFVFGRLHGLTPARLSGLLAREGGVLTASFKAADRVVLTHARVAKAIDDEGALLPPFDDAADRLWTEKAFRAHLGLVEGSGEPGAYSAAHLCSVSGLPLPAVHALRLFDLIGAADDSFTFADLSLARRVRHWRASAPLPKIIATLHRLAAEDVPLSRIELAPIGGDQLGAVIAGKLTRLGGQLEMSLGDEALDPAVVFAAAESAESHGEHEEAARLYSLAARLDRRDPVIAFNLGNVLDELGRLPEAAVEYQRALMLDANFAEAWFNLGVLSARRGDRLQAKACYRRAAACEPAASDATFNLARLLCEEGSYVEALPLWDQLASDSASPDRLEARKWATICRMEIARTTL
ncbi:MAG: O-linked GlcNAc transferase [Hyphomicrobiales bacterium]|nr:O-linked GlcNAc transferase [Hyphomicrobiales bacterium]